MQGKEFLGNFVEQGIFRNKRVMVIADLSVSADVITIEGVAKSLAFLQNHGAKVVMVPDADNTAQSTLTELQNFLSQSLLRMAVQKDTGGDIALSSLDLDLRDYDVVVHGCFHQSVSREYQKEVASNCAALVVDSLAVIDEDLVPRIPEGYCGVDVGSATIRRFCDELMDCKTVLWNGPMGICEQEEYARGTRALMRYLSDLTAWGSATTIMCGGETVAAVEKESHNLDLVRRETAMRLGTEAAELSAPLRLQFSHVSTGGGAALEFLEGKQLPGVQALEEEAQGKGSREGKEATFGATDGHK